MSIYKYLHLSEETIKLYAKERGYLEETIDDIEIFSNLENRRYISDENFEFLDNLERVKIENLKIGDIVRVSYCTYSQKYMMEEEYQPFMGKVFFIDTINQNVLFYYDKYDRCSKKFIKTITSLLRPHCSYFGESKGHLYVMHRKNKTEKVCF